MNGILKGIRPLDYVLAALMTAAGVLLMLENITAPADADLAHPLSTTTGAMLPGFLLVTLPILWRRRNVLAVVGVTLVTTALHVVLFGWVTRCGVALPLAFALSYAVARYARATLDQLVGLAGVVALQMIMLLRDSSIDRVIDALPIVIAGTALFYGIGLYVQNRVTKKIAVPVAEHATV